MSVSFNVFWETQWRHSVKTRLYNTSSPILYTVKRIDVSRWKQGYIRTLPHTSLYWPARWKQRRSGSLSFTELESEVARVFVRLFAIERVLTQIHVCRCPMIGRRIFRWSVHRHNWICDSSGISGRYTLWYVRHCNRHGFSWLVLTWIFL